MGVPEIGFYGIILSLEEALDDLEYIDENWFARYPDGVSDIDMSKEGEAFIKIKERQTRLRELNEHSKNIQNIISMIYRLSKKIDSANAQCKISQLSVREQMAQIREIVDQLRQAEEQKRISEQSQYKQNNSSNTKRKKSRHIRRNF